MNDTSAFLAALLTTEHCCHSICYALPPCRSQVVDGCLDILDGEGAPGDSVHLLASHRSPSPPRERSSAADRLQRLPGQVRAHLAEAREGSLAWFRGSAGGTPEWLVLLVQWWLAINCNNCLLPSAPSQDFQWVLEAVLLAATVYLDHCAAVGTALHAILSAAKATKQQLAAAAQDARECCQAVAEAAAARWSKLLGGRARGGEGGGTGSIIRWVTHGVGAGWGGAGEQASGNRGLACKLLPC